MDRRLNIKVEMVKRDWRHRDMAAQLRERGFMRIVSLAPEVL